MSRYIDADALREKLIEYIGLTNGFDRAFNEAPTIDIVFCKDCKFNYGNEHNCSFNPDDIVCTYWESDGLQANDFCSSGERSEP